MRKWKQSLIYVALVLCLVVAAACTGGETPTEPITPDPTPEIEPTAPVDEPDIPINTEPVAMRVAALKGPTGIGMVFMMSEMADAQDGLYPSRIEYPHRYSFELSGAPDDVAAKLANGSVDIACIPSNLAANLYAKTNGQIQMLGINTYGMLYLLEKGEVIQSWEDLRGKTITCAGQGSNPEYILNYLLTANGLTPGEDVTIDFKSEQSEVSTLLASDMIEIAMLPEPFVTTTMAQAEDIRIVFDITEEWDKTDAQGQVAMTCVVGRSDFIAEHPDAVNAFLVDLTQSIDFALNDPQAAGQLCADFEIIANPTVAAQAIPNCSLTMVTGGAMREVIEGYFQVLYDANPQAVGGAMPDENFYYHTSN